MGRGCWLVLAALAACADADRGVLRADYAPDGSLAQRPAELARANVVLVSIDTLRADYLGTYGQELPTSPALDALAEESVVFERALSCSPWTTPAHLSLMTSLYPAIHGIFEYPTPGVLDPRVVTLAEILRAHGWRTAGFTEGGHARGSTGLADGFERFPDWEPIETHYPSRLSANVRRATHWLDEGPGEPFFLFFHTYEPHYEYGPPSAYVELVAPDFDATREERRLAGALNAWNAGGGVSLEQLGVLYRHHLQGRLRKLPVARREVLLERLEEFARSEWRGSPGFADDLQYIRMLYAAEIRRTDELLATLFDRLRDMGVWERTLVVVTSDHGEGLMDHGELEHGASFFDEVLRVPLMIRFPGGWHAGLRHGAQVRTVDVVPTVLDWIGLPVPRAAVGRSLLPLLGQDRPLPGFAEAWLKPRREDETKALDDGRWKLVRNLRTGQELLFDLAADPGERNDLADEGARGELRALRAELERVVERNAEQAADYDVAPGELSASQRKELEALGYLGAEDD